MPSLLDTLQGPAQPQGLPLDPTSALLTQLMQQHRGNPEQAMIGMMPQRWQDPMSATPRNAEHALFAQVLMQKFGPFLGPLALSILVPGYTGVKALGQPFGFFPGASQPSFDEMKWGLAPLWGGIPRFGTQSVLPQLVAQGPNISSDELAAEEQNIQEAIEDIDELRDEGKMREFRLEKPLLERRIRAWQMRRRGEEPLPPGGAY